MKTAYGFSRRGPDNVAEELATVLSRNASYEFKELFLIVHANLRARNAASGGEEMLRLRAYEKLQNLVQGGIVKKMGKKYRGVPAGIATFFATAAELNARFAAGTHTHPPSAVTAKPLTSAVRTPVETVKMPVAPAAPAPKRKTVRSRAGAAR